MTDIASMVLVIIGSWLLYTVATAYSSGWRGLAKTYRSANAPKPAYRGGITGMNMDEDGQAHRPTTGADVTPAPEGLYMSKPWFMNVLQPPLLVPWNDLVHMTPISMEGSLRPTTVMARDGTKIRFRPDVFPLVERHMNQDKAR